MNTIPIDVRRALGALDGIQRRTSTRTRAGERAESHPRGGRAHGVHRARCIAQTGRAEARASGAGDARGAMGGATRTRRRGAMGGATRAARVFTLACAFVACARAVYGAATADVCVGVSWMARGALTPSRTVHPVTAFPSAHPTYVHAKQKACLGFTNSSEPEGAVGGVTLAREVSNYYSAASGACATTPALSAGAMFYNRAELTSTAAYAESNTGIEKDKTVRIVLVSDDSAGAHIVILAGASTTLSSSRPEVGLRMEGRSLQNVNNVFIEEPRGFGNQNTGGIGCDPTTSSTTDCYELDADLGVASFRWGSRSAQRGVVIGYIADVDEDVSLKFTMLERINAVEIGSFDKNTYGLTWETIPIANAMDGFRLRSATCANHCLSHSTCASCATDDACGYCAVESK